MLSHLQHWMEVDVEQLEEQLENMELVHMEVDQQVVHLEWELANTQWDVVMLVAERCHAPEWTPPFRHPGTSQEHRKDTKSRRR